MKAILQHFPPVEYACAYGSVAIPQHAYDASNSLLDFIFVVLDAAEWHRLNHMLNPLHYACPPSGAAFLQAFGGGIYYNVNVQVEGRRIKYGIVQKDAFLQDLYEWRTLYLAGRLHKPVIPLLEEPVGRQYTDAICINHRHAANVALLSLPKRFTQYDFLCKIVRLSYLGDFRVSLAEDPQKVQHIVQGQHKGLEALYRPYLTSDSVTKLSSHGHYARGDHYEQDDHYEQGDHYEQDDNPIGRLNRLAQLPITLLTRLSRRASLFHLAGNPEITPRVLESSVASIVRGPALVQAAKGIVSGGLTNSMYYAFAKIVKRFR